MLTLISAGAGVFYTTGAQSFPVENIYGQTVELFGDGVYQNDSVFKASANKGTDLAMLVVAALFAAATTLRTRWAGWRFLQVGLLAGLLYYAAFLVFGVTFNRLFPVYVALFSASLFTMVILCGGLLREDNLPAGLQQERLKGTAVFIMASGLSALVWLPFVLPALLYGPPLEAIETYTTEVTYVLDFGVILPLFLGCGIALFQGKPIGYKLAPIPLTFMPVIALCVLGQTVVQLSAGMEIPLGDLLGLVVSFLILGGISVLLNVRFLRRFRQSA